MDTTNTSTILLAGLAILVIVVLLGIVFARRQRTKRLREQFGPEYERAVQEVGDKHRAESELEARLDRMKSLEIRQL